MNNTITTYDIAKRKFVKCGDVVGDTLVRHVSSKHFMRVVNGYGIQEEAFGKVIERGINHISLIVDTTDVSWNSTIKDWKEYGKVADYGHGKQRFLSMKYMHAKKLQAEKAEITKPKEVEQLNLLSIDKRLGARLLADKDKILNKKV